MTLHIRNLLWVLLLTGCKGSGSSANPHCGEADAGVCDMATCSAHDESACVANPACQALICPSCNGGQMFIECLPAKTTEMPGCPEIACNVDTDSGLD
jgi:hypothetical protein